MIPSQLQWEQISETEIRGFLASDAKTSLFLLEAADDGLVKLSGAFLPDTADGELWTLTGAKLAAWALLICWLNERGRAILELNDEEED